jgi:hypothetical protein
VTCFELESNSRNPQVAGIEGILGGTGISGVGVLKLESETYQYRVQHKAIDQ